MNVSDPPPSLAGVPTRRVHDRAAYPRLARELATLRAMVDIYCRSLHAPQEALCPDCDDLIRYATRRLDRCIFGEGKPTCASCTVHCYNAAMRERVRAVMRYAGPRMVWRHPVLALAHVLDKRRKAPALSRAAADIRTGPAARGAPRR